MEGKELLLQILNGSAVTSSLALVQSLNDEIASAEELLELYQKGEYLLFVNKLCLNEHLFESVLNYVSDDNASVLLKRKVLAIKGASAIEKNYSLSSTEVNELAKISVLLKKVASDTSDKAKLIESSSITNSDIERIKEKLNRDEIFTPADIILTEKIVRCANPSNGDVNWDKVITYLNAYNGEKLKKLAEDKIKGRLLERANFKNPEVDIFKHHDMTKSTFKPTCKIEEHEVRQSLKEIIASVGFDLDKFDQMTVQKLLKCDLKVLADNAKYLFDNGYIKLIGSNNYLGVTEVLCGTSKDEFVNIIKLLTDDYKFTSEEIASLLKRATVVFTKDGFENFKRNMAMLKENDIPNSIIVARGILFLIGDSKKNKAVIDKLQKEGINISDFLNENLGMIYDADRVLRNLKNLKLYGFNLGDDKGALSVLTTFDIAGVIDQFIELGINEHVHSGENELKNIKDLMVRRVFYAFKNDLPVWESKDSYKSIEKTPCLTEEEIIPLINDYPILLYLEEGHRLAIYSDTKYAQIKRRTEFVFDRQVISRLKTYRVFDSLVRAGIKPEEAVIKALTFNTPLEPNEIEAIKGMLHITSGVKSI